MKGRYLVAFWLLAFLLATGVVAVRTQQGLALAAEMSRLRERRLALEAQGADLERRIRQLSSRQVLGAKVKERIGLAPPLEGAIIVQCIAEAGRPCPDVAK